MLSLMQMLRRLSQLEKKGHLSQCEKQLLKDRLLDKTLCAEVEAAFSAWGVEEAQSEQLTVSLKALLSSYALERQDDLDQVLNARSPVPQFGPMRNKTILFYSKDMENVASEAARKSRGRLVLGKIDWQRFDTPDGWPHLFIEDTHDLQYNDVMYIASFHSPQVVFEQLSIIYALPRLGCRSLRVIVPFFAVGTMERVTVTGEVATAAVLARMLSMTPQTAGGPTQFVFLDIHALQEQFYFSDNVIVLLKSCVRLLLEVLADLAKTEEVVIVFPDDGAFKRFYNKFERFKMVTCHKLRLESNLRRVEIRDGIEHVRGSHCVIVDDLVKSGGTMIECAEVLSRHGAEKVSCYVTHGVFPNDSFTKFLHSTHASNSTSVRFENFWMTDSIPAVANRVNNRPPFKVLPIAPLITFLRQNFWDKEAGPDPKRYD